MRVSTTAGRDPQDPQLLAVTWVQVRIRELERRHYVFGRAAAKAVEQDRPARQFAHGQ